MIYKSVFCVVFSLILTSCTYSINLVHSEGKANDLIDETSSPTANPVFDFPEFI